ncbi:MAG: extracellular solute-binding protein [Anaerolineae bacterium]|nr:extracellular solute-binding protein [Anaerolineae bacterium]
MFKHTRFYPLCSLLLLFVLLVSACQTGTPAVSSGKNANTPAATPSPVRLVSATPQPSPTATQPPITIEPDKLNGSRILVWHSLAGESRQALEDLIKDFNQRNTWGIIASSAQMGDSKTLFDLLESNLLVHNNDGLPNLILAAPEQIAGLSDHTGAIINLNPYIADARYGLSQERVNDIAEAYWRQDSGLLTFQSGLPALRDMHVMFYNQTWANELGFKDTPTTLEGFKQQVCTAAKTVAGNKANDGTGGWIVTTDAETLLSWMYAFGTLEMPTRATQPYNFKTASNEKMLAYLSDLFSGNCAWNSRLNSPYTYFANRQTLLYSGTLQDISIQTRVNEHLKSSDLWKVIPYPTSLDKPTLVTSGLSYAVVDGSATSAGTSSAPGSATDLAAWLLASWLNQPEHMVKLSNASGMLPAGDSALQNMQNYKTQFPQWKEASGWLSRTQTTPGIGSWQAARLVLADAGWMVFNPKPTPDSPATVLDMLDRTIYDVLLHRP